MLFVVRLVLPRCCMLFVVEFTRTQEFCVVAAAVTICMHSAIIRLACIVELPQLLLDDVENTRIIDT